MSILGKDCRHCGKTLTLKLGDYTPHSRLTCSVDCGYHLYLAECLRHKQPIMNTKEQYASSWAALNALFGGGDG